MPQMSPLSWLTLFSLFIILYLLNMVKLYFSNIYKINSSEKQLNIENKTLNWKW